MPPAIRDPTTKTAWSAGIQLSTPGWSQVAAGPLKLVAGEAGRTFAQRREQPGAPFNTACAGENGLRCGGWPEYFGPVLVCHEPVEQDEIRL